MLRSIFLAACFSSVAIGLPAVSHAADKTETKKLSKKEKKALAAEQGPKGRVAMMCIASMAFSTLDDEAIMETPDYIKSKAFWSARVDEAVSYETKPKKKAKLRAFYRQQGSASLKRLGGGNIILGGKKADSICGMMEAENFDGPTTKAIMGR